MRSVNVFAPELDQSSEREGFRWRGARLGPQIGAGKIGASVYELEDGQRTFPYHYHHGMEEWLIALEGAPTVRTPSGDRTLRPGDVLCFPAGSAGAHQVRGPGTVLILSANRVPETVEYPDSDKLGAVPPRKFFRTADAVDYWEGE